MDTASDKRPVGRYRLLLIAATAIWGLGFGIGKYAIGIIGPTWFTCLRFIGSAVILLIVLLPHLKKHFNKKVLKAGVIIGAASFFGFWTQFIGLGLTTASNNAFLSTCYCITVPFIWWVIARRRPTSRIFLAALLCVIGIGLVSVQGGLAIGAGDAMSIVSAFAYGAEIVAIGLVMRSNDVLSVTVVQQFAAGILAALFACVTGPLPDPAAFGDMHLIGSLAYVIVLSAAFGAVAQNLAQAHVSPSEAGILCSLESVFCVLFSVALFGEVLTAQTIAGFVFIFAALMLAQSGDVVHADSAAP